ncbi:MAG: hypothetical protein K940chlam9_00698 [Chlamydiae bacterium]|nr:hypothetical protein [Chlamydiota bacterium]
MRKVELFVCFLILQVLLLSPFLGAANLCSYLDFEGGYRWDKLDNRVVFYGGEFFAGGQIFNQINSVQIGGRGRWMITDYLVLKGLGHYGWVLDGEFDQTTYTGDLDGNVWDVSAAIGWALQCHPCWGVIPSVGWAYSELDITVKDVSTGIVPPESKRISLSNIDCKQSIQGPWGGFELFFDPSCCLDISLAYELHKGRWRGDYFPDVGDFGPDFGRIGGFAAKRTNNHMWGNIFRMEGIYTFCSCFDVGLLLTYEFWKGQYASSGNFKRTITPVAPFTNTPVIDVGWKSFSAMVQVGYRF